MNRSAGVTASSVLVFIGSALTLIWAAFAVLGIFVLANQESQPRFLVYFMVVFVAVMFGASGWGITTGVGLMNLREWARISMLIFGGLLLFFTLPGLLIVPFIPMQPQNNVPEHVFTVIRIVMGIFYAGLSALAGWWLYFFNKKDIKAQFKSGAGAASFAAPGTTDSPTPPLSIAIVGWYLVITSPIFLLMAVFRFPLFLFGYLIRGNLAAGVLIPYAAMHIFAGIGLLKLRPWGRTLAIFYFTFIILQAILAAALPGSDARFQEAMAEFATRFNFPPTPIHLSPWFSALSVAPLYALLLWFLITRKRFFKGSQEMPSV